MAYYNSIKNLLDNNKTFTEVYTIQSTTGSATSPFGSSIINKFSEGDILLCYLTIIVNAQNLYINESYLSNCITLHNSSYCTGSGYFSSNDSSAACWLYIGRALSTSTRITGRFNTQNSALNGLTTNNRMCCKVFKLSNNS